MSCNRRSLQSCVNTNENHGCGQEGSIKSVTCRSKLLVVALGLDHSGLETVGRIGAVGTRLFPPSSDKILDSLGKVRMQVRRSNRTFPNPRSEAHNQWGKTVVRRCGRQVVERAQPASLSHELHRLPRVPDQLAGRHWRVVSRAVSSLRAYHVRTTRQRIGSIGCSEVQRNKYGG